MGIATAATAKCSLCETACANTAQTCWLGAGTSFPVTIIFGRSVMGGRTVIGREHQPHCEFPWDTCRCSPEIQALLTKAYQKMDELQEIIKRIREHRDGNQPT